MKRAVAPVAFVALVACSTGDAAAPSRAALLAGAPPDFASGTRLRARTFTIGGTIAVLDAFYDRAGDLDCTFADAAGAHVGPSRMRTCLPLVLARHRESSGPFGDSACAQPVGLVTPGEDPAFVVVEPLDACATGPVVFRAGARANRFTYALDARGACLRSPVRADVVSLGERMPDDAFVRAEEAIEERGGRIAARVLVASDGARQTIGGWDRERGIAVAAGIADDATLRWLPAQAAFVGAGNERWSDLACTQPLATKIGRDAICPLAAAFAFVGSCGRGAFHVLGPAVAAFTTYARDADSGGCVPSGPSAGLFVHAVGDAIPTATFEPAVVVERGFGVVRRRVLAGAFGDAVASSDVVDTETGEPCAPSVVTDGTTESQRCAPLARVPVTLFSDAECTEPAFAEPVGDCDDPRNVPRRVRTTDEPPRVMEIVGPASAVYTASSAGCVRQVPAVPSRLFAVRPIDPAALPAVEAKLE